MCFQIAEFRVAFKVTFITFLLFYSSMLVGVVNSRPHTCLKKTADSLINGAANYLRPGFSDVHYKICSYLAVTEDPLSPINHVHNCSWRHFIPSVRFHLSHHPGIPHRFPTSIYNHPFNWKSWIPHPLIGLKVQKVCMHKIIPIIPTLEQFQS